MINIKWKKAIYFLWVIALWSCQQDNVEPKATIQIRALSDIEKQVVNQSNSFGLHLLRQLNQDHPSGNFFISPFGISMSLGMAMNGATDSTLQSIKCTLEVKDLDNLEVNKGYNDLINLLPDIDKRVNFLPANALCYRQDLHIQEMSRDIISAYYQSAIEALDFGHQKSKDLINKWVEDKTNKRIRELVKGTEANDGMYLVNATYFKAPWTQAFDKNQTATAPFYLANGETADINFMFTNGAECLRYQDEDIMLLDLPYGNKQYSMTLIMPTGETNLTKFMNTLTPDRLNEYYAGVDTLDVDIYLPKLTLAYKMELQPALKKMGMGIAFSDSASFGNLFQETSSLKIDKVIHETYLEMSEQGTETSASIATGINPNAQKVSVTFNKPFLFFIREKHTGMLLFAGKFMNPTLN